MHNSASYSLLCIYCCTCLFVYLFHHPRNLAKFKALTTALFWRHCFFSSSLSFCRGRKTNEWHKSNKLAQTNQLQNKYTKIKTRPFTECSLCLCIFISSSVSFSLSLCVSFSYSLFLLLVSFLRTVGKKIQFNLFNASVSKNFDCMFRNEALKISFDVYVLRAPPSLFFQLSVHTILYFQRHFSTGNCKWYPNEGNSKKSMNASKWKPSTVEFIHRDFHIL